MPEPHFPNLAPKRLHFHLLCSLEQVQHYQLGADERGLVCALDALLLPLGKLCVLT